MFALHIYFDTLAAESFIPHLCFCNLGWLAWRMALCLTELYSALLSTRTRAVSLLILHCCICLGRLIDMSRELLA